ncbi:transcription factor E2F3-like isoform X2 [Synchiropus splendidus]|uniref:transcription factor E2F3-like isoform X2 n=1 Tax=Synchiropus splendidus TaxID=270530 RepID=UPI00237E1D44|nr:transcription factor E2F3-like isoform X2 [Synchiropus splendidus]
MSVKLHLMMELGAGEDMDTQAGGSSSTVEVPHPCILFKEPRQPRVYTSLGFLTQSFAQLMKQCTDGVMDLNNVAQTLNVPKRRIYDITNVLLGIELITKRNKNQIVLTPDLTLSRMPEDVEEEKRMTEKESELDKMIYICRHMLHQMFVNQASAKYMYLTHEDVRGIPMFRDQTVMVIKAPADSMLEVPHPAEGYQVHIKSSKGPIQVGMCCDDPDQMEVTPEAKGCSVNSTGRNSHDTLSPVPSQELTIPMNEADSKSALLSKIAQLISTD